MAGRTRVKTKLLLVLRHGEKDSNGMLTSQGRLEMKEYGEMLRIITDGRSIVMYSSPVQRARESAEIVAGALGVSDIRLRKELDVEARAPELEVLLRDLESSAGDVFMLVTHRPVISEIKSILRDGLRQEDGGLWSAAMARSSG